MLDLDGGPMVLEERGAFSARHACLLLLSGGAGFTILTFSDQSLWVDEFFTLAAADPARSVLDLFRESLVYDVHPPLYFLFEHAWLVLAGTSEIALRLPSLIFFLAALAAAFRTERYLAGGQARFALPALLACAFGASSYAQEARSYELLLLGSWLVADLTIRIVDAATRNQQKNKLFILHLLAATLTSFTHYFGFLIAVSSFAVILVALLRSGETPKKVLLSGTVLACLFLPWTAYHFWHIQQIAGGRFWIDNDIPGIGRRFLSLLFGTVPVAVASAAILTAAAVGARHVLRSARMMSLVGICVLSVALAAALSVHTPVMTGRNFIILLPPILMAIFIVFHAPGCSAKRQWALALFAALLLFGSLTEDRAKEDWRQAGRVIGESTACDGAPILVLSTGMEGPEFYQYYVKDVRPGFIAARFGRTTALAPLHKTVDLAAELDHYLPALTASGCPVMLWAGHVQDDKAGLIMALFDERRIAYRAMQMTGHLLLLKQGE